MNGSREGDELTLNSPYKLDVESREGEEMTLNTPYKLDVESRDGDEMALNTPYKLNAESREGAEMALNSPYKLEVDSREGDELTMNSPDKLDVESRDGDEMTLNSPDELDVEPREDMGDLTGQECVDLVALEKNTPQQNDNPAYRCHVCRQGFERSSDFKTHLRTHFDFLPASDFLLCFICGNQFKDEVELSTHLATHPDDERSRCGVCGEQYNHFTRLHTGHRPFKCSLCLRTFQKSKDFHCHLNVHSGYEAYKCHLCEKGYSRKDRLRIHKQAEHGVTFRRCEVCKQFFEDETSFEEHKKNHDKVMYMECNVCQKVFSHIRSLGNHQIYHNGKTSFTCNLCDTKLDGLSMIKEHVKEHNSNASHPCNFCQHVFSTAKDLINHKKKHFQNVPHTFKCKQCDAVLSTNRELRAHHFKTNHASVLPFQCGQCRKRFANAKSLHRHEQSIHRDARHTCDLCGLDFSRPENLTAHVTNIHGDKSSPQCCTICTMRFRNARELANHYRAKHGTSAGHGAKLASPTNGNSTATITSANQSFSGSGINGHRESDSVHVDKTRNSSRGSTSVISGASDIDRGNNFNVNTAFGTGPTGTELGELDQNSLTAVVHACRFCGKRFAGQFYRRLHCKRHKEVEIVKKCEKCRKAFGRHDQFTRHHCANSKMERYACDICDEAFTSSFLFLRHRMIHKGPMHKCDKCKKVFTRKCNLDRHKAKNHSWQSEYKCVLCPRYFFSKQAHFLHVQSHVRTSNKCTVCKVGFRSADKFDQHVQQYHKVGNLYKCHTCTDEFVSMLSYQVHQLTHAATVVHTCDVCDKNFKDEHQLNIHREMHTDTTSDDISCNWCGMGFSTYKRVRKHQYRNMCWKGRSFKCILCGDSFQRLDLLQTHIKTHVKSNRNAAIVNGDCDESIAGDIDDNVVVDSSENVDEDGEAPVSETSELTMEEGISECNDDTMARSEFLNEDDVVLDDGLLGSDPGQGSGNSVMFSCGECNSEFSTLPDLKRHIDTHDTTSQDRTTDPSLTRGHAIEKQDMYDNNVTCSQASAPGHDTESRAFKMDLQVNSHGHTVALDPTGKHTTSAYNTPEDTDNHSQLMEGRADRLKMPILNTDTTMSSNQDSRYSCLYKCGLCEERFQDIVGLNDHISAHEDDKNSYKCDICGNVLQSVLSFHSHCVSHATSDTEPESTYGNTQTVPPRVNVFEMPFLTSSQESDRDLTTKSHTINMKPEDCISTQHSEDLPKATKEERLGIFDLLQFDNDRTDTKDATPDAFKCDICANTFVSEFEHRRHMKQHRSDQETQVDDHSECGLTNVSLVNNTESIGALQNTNVIDSMMLYRCGICDLSFCVPSKLMDHSRVHLEMDLSGVCVTDSDSSMMSVSPTIGDNDFEEPEMPLLSAISNYNVAAPDMTHTCGACARTFPSADALYSHCRVHVTSPTVKIRRLSILDNNVSGWVLVGDLPSDVYTTTSYTQEAKQGDTYSSECHERFSSDVENDTNTPNQDSNDHHNQDRSAYDLTIRQTHKPTNLITSSISKSAVPERRMMTLSNRLGPSDASRKRHRLGPHNAVRNRKSLGLSNASRERNKLGPPDASRKGNFGRNIMMSLLKCRICFRLFDTEHGLLVHQSMIHPNDHHTDGLLVHEPRFTCTVCYKIFTTSHALHIHEVRSHAKLEGIFKCTTCGMVFPSASRRRAHNKLHTTGDDNNDAVASSDRLFKCLLCDRVFGSLHGIRIHSNHHTGEDCASHLSTAHHFRCLLCSASFYTVLQLRSHAMSAHTDIAGDLQQQSPINNNRGGISNKIKNETVINSNTETSVQIKDISPADLPVLRSPSSPYTQSSSSSPVRSVGFKDRPCQCLVCSRVFPSALELRGSCRQCPADSKLRFPYKCLICQRTFTSIKGIRIHMASHTDFTLDKSEKRVISEDTDTREIAQPKVPKFSESSSATEPNIKHNTATRNIASPGIPKFSESSPATEPSIKHNLPTRCLVCCREFLSNHGLKIHMRIHPRFTTRQIAYQSPSKTSNGPKPKDTQSPNLVQQSATVTDSSRSGTIRYKCRVCTRTFSSTLIMLRHMKTHTQKFQCDMCGDVFNDVWTFQSHRSSHKVIVSHECDLCKKEFPTLSSMVRHRKAHAGKFLPYSCDMCSDEFAAIEELREHCKTHREDTLDGTDNEDNATINDNDTKVQSKGGNNKDQEQINNENSSLMETSVLEQQPLADVDNYKGTNNNGHEQENVENGFDEQIHSNGYKCDICDQNFKSREEIGEHCRTHTETDATRIKTRADADLFKSMKVSGAHLYRCNLCDREYMALYSIQRHYRLHERKMMYICHVCDKTFQQPASLREHLMAHSKDALFRCNVCHMQYNNMKTFQLHKRTHSEDATETCAGCCKDFKGHQAFLDHKIECDRERPWVCDICGKGFTRRNILTEHEKIHTDTRKYRCHVCGNRYAHTQNLKRHLETAHDKNITTLDAIMNMTHDDNGTRSVIQEESTRARSQDNGRSQVEASTTGAQVPTASGRWSTDDQRHKCMQCSRHYSSMESLQRHTVSHMREKNGHMTTHLTSHEKEGSTTYGKDFREKKDIQQHVDIIHKDTPTHQCCVCGNVYTQTTDLEKHLWNAHHERLFTCDLCLGRFGSSDGLNRHMIQKHDATSHKCPECVAAFSSPERLQRHIAAVHPQQPYACTICSIQFQSMSEKQRHVTAAHAQSVNARPKAIPWATELPSRKSENTNKVLPTERSSAHFTDAKRRLNCMCRICKKPFLSIVDRQKHMVDLHGVAGYKFSCSTCGQMFATIARLKQHTAVHSGD